MCTPCLKFSCCNKQLKEKEKGLKGEDTILNEQPYRYLTVDEMKSLGDDSLPIDVTRDERFDSNLMMAMDDSISPQHSYNQMSAPIDNIDIKHPLNVGFLVSFLVDARGGAMRGCRHSGVRVMVPPRCASMPTRVTCRYLRRDKLPHPPPLMEGEALASRILELGPVGAKFLGPVMLEVPHFGSLRGSEREIVILRSDNGETWREHSIDNCEEIIQEVLSHSFEKEDQTQHDDTTRITRIVTTEFPHYFAVVSRIRQEVHAIGPEGGMVSSSVVSQVQAVFPEGALTKKIKVGLQSQPIPAELVSKLLGNRVAVSPIVTVEPRRRKFHKPITLTIPVPQAASKGMINQYSGDAPTLRLLCSITGGTTRAQWEDVTGSTPLTFVNDCVSFTTTVSARFWLMDCRNVGDATKMATELYREAIHVPFMAKFVVFVKRVDVLEARLRIFCMTDDKEDKTLEHQEHFTEVAKSRDVEVLEGKSQYIEFAGNLVPVTKSGDQLKLGFRAFRENRLPFMVKVKDPHADSVGRVLFMREPKVAKGEPPQHPACVLNIVLPENIIPETGLSLSAEELNKFSYLQVSSDTSRVDLRLSDISNLLGDDWVPLASELGLSNTEINSIKTDYPGSNAQLALTMLRYWFQQHSDRASANELESALTRVGRSDIVQQCITKQQEPEKTSYHTRIIESADYATVKKQKDPIHESDDYDEKKYTAEEKSIEEEDIKKSVQERKQEIEKRLSLSKNIDVILDQKPLEKRKSLVSSDSQASDKEKETAEEKKVVIDHDVADELAELSFEQKRLSFEKGLSLERKKSEEKPSEGLRSSFDRGTSLEKKTPKDKPTDVPKPSQETKISDEKVEIKPTDVVKTESVNIIEEEKHIAAELMSDVSKQDTEEKQLSFQEKRLSFERGLSQTKITPLIKETETSVETKEVVHQPTAEDKRRDSVLFEGVSQGLEKLDSTPDKFSQPQQDLLSPKVVKTPPPSPAEFKDSAWSKSSSQSSQEGKSLDIDGAAQDAIKKSTDAPLTTTATEKSDNNAPVSSTVLSIDVNESKKLSCKPLNEEELVSCTVISIHVDDASKNPNPLTLDSNIKHPRPPQSQTMDSSVKENATLLKGSNANHGNFSLNKSEQQNKIITRVPSSHVSIKNGSSVDEEKLSSNVNGSIPSNSDFLIGPISPTCSVSKTSLLNTELASTDLNNSLSGSQSEIDNLSTRLVKAVENASSALVSPAIESKDTWENELMKSSEKSIEECKTLVDSVIRYKNLSGENETSPSFNSNSVSMNDPRQLVGSEEKAAIDAGDVLCLGPAETDEQRSIIVDRANSEVLAALEHVCKLSESSLDDLNDIIKNSSTSPSANMLLPSTEEVKKIEIKKTPLLHKDMVDEVLVNSFELPCDEQSKDKFIDMLIEQETAKLIISDNESDDDSDDSSDNGQETGISSRIEATNRVVPGLINKKSNRREENGTSSSDDENASYIVEEPPPKKNVTFKLDLTESGEHGIEDEGSVEFEEISDEDVENPDSIEENSEDELIDEKRFNPVERKFERMASETLYEAEKTNPAFDREYQRIVSQLSNEEVDECLLIWDECAFAPSDDQNVKWKPAEVSINLELDEEIDQAAQESGTSKDENDEALSGASVVSSTSNVKPGKIEETS